MKRTFVMLVPAVWILASCGEKQWGPDPWPLPATQMVFACLNDPDGAGEKGDVVYSKDTGVVSMTWRLPKRARGTPYFKVYDGSSGDVLKRTTDNQWEFRVPANEARTYQLYVEATDQDGETSCYEQNKIVAVTIEP